MRISRPFVVAVMVGAGLLVAAQETSQPGSESHGDPFVNAMVRVSFEPAALPFDGAIADALLTSQAVWGRALEKLHASTAMWSISFHAVSPDPKKDEHCNGTLIAKLMVRSYRPDQPPTLAADLLKEAISQFRQALLSYQAEDIRELDRRRLAASEVELGSRERAKMLEAECNALLEQTGQTDLSRAAILERLKDLESQQRGLELERAALGARKAAIEQQIANASDRAALAVHEDEAAKQLTLVVETRESELQRTEKLFSSGSVSEGEIRAAQRELALARASLAQRRQEAARAAGGDVLAGLNADLAKTIVVAAENEARLKFVSEQLAGVRGNKLLERAEEYERKSTELDTARGTLATIISRRENLNGKQRAAMPPSVVVLGEDAAPASQPVQSR